MNEYQPKFPLSPKEDEKLYRALKEADSQLAGVINTLMNDLFQRMKSGPSTEAMIEDWNAIQDLVRAQELIEDKLEC